HFALRVGIEAPEIAGLLARDQDVVAIATLADHDAGAEVVILQHAVVGARAVRVGLRLIELTAEMPYVARQRLEAPLQLAGREIECEHGVARVGCRQRSCLAGAGVDEPALDIDRRRRPDRRAGRAALLHARGADLAGVLRVLHRVRGPQLVTVARVERHDGAVAFAAFVFRVGAAADAGRGDRHDDAIADQHRRAGDAAEGVVPRFG